MFVRFVAQKIDDGIGGFGGIIGINVVFLLVVPVSDIGQIRPSQIKHEQNAQQDAAEPGAFSGKNSRKHEQAKSDGQREQKNKPTDLPDAERSHLFCHFFVRKSRLLQITDQARFFRGVNQPPEHADDKGQQAKPGPVSIEPAGFCPPLP